MKSRTWISPSEKLLLIRMKAIYHRPPGATIHDVSYRVTRCNFAMEIAA